MQAAISQTEEERFDRLDRLADELAYGYFEIYWSKLSRDHKQTGSVPSHPFNLLGIIRRVERFLNQGAIQMPSKHLVELGCGYGISTAIWQAAGYEVTGYDINSDALSFARRLSEQVQRAGLGERATFALQNYFPKEYLALREQGDALAQKVEKRNLRIQRESEEDRRIVYRDEEGLEVGHISKETLAEPRLFYCYPWAAQLPAVFELFSRYARDDAILVYNFCKEEAPFLDTYSIRELNLFEPSENILVKNEKLADRIWKAHCDLFKT